MQSRVSRMHLDFPGAILTELGGKKWILCG